jgi:hypothetical protein
MGGNGHRLDHSKPKSVDRQAGITGSVREAWTLRGSAFGRLAPQCGLSLQREKGLHAACLDSHQLQRRKSGCAQEELSGKKVIQDEAHPTECRDHPQGWLASGTEGVESGISSHVRWHLGSGFGTGATEQGGLIRNHGWGRLGTGLKAIGRNRRGFGSVLWCLIYSPSTACIELADDPACPPCRQEHPQMIPSLWLQSEPEQEAAPPPRSGHIEQRSEALRR